MRDILFTLGVLFIVCVIRLYQAMIYIATIAMWTLGIFFIQPPLFGQYWEPFAVLWTVYCITQLGFHYTSQRDLYA